MFQLAAKGGYGAQCIANYLNERGIKNHSGKNWHPASIQGMLRNILYTGVLRSGKSRTHGDCDGQTGYTVEKLDGMIDSIIHTIFAKVSSLIRDDIIAERFQYDRAARKAALDKAKKEYEKAESELKSLKGEIIKSISGESPFAPELLNSVIGEQESKCGELRKACILAQQELDDNDSALANMGQRYDDILEWSAVYDHVAIPAKKIIVAHIIERVDVCRGYQLHLKLNLSVEQFLCGLDCMPDVETSLRTSV